MSGSRSVIFLLLRNVVCVCQGVVFLPVGPPPSARRGSGAGPTRALIPGTRCRHGRMRPGRVGPKNHVPDRWSACAQQIWLVKLRGACRGISGQEICCRRTSALAEGVHPSPVTVANVTLCGECAHGGATCRGSSLKDNGNGEGFC